jgi:aminoglycoside phosphotransferase (APT) family kinase protein
MHSRTKTQVARRDIDRIAARCTGGEAGVRTVTELVEGYFSSAYGIEFVDGRKVVLKVAPPDDVPLLRYELDLLGAEVAVMERLRRDTDVPVPRVLLHDPSREIIPAPYFVMEFVEGTPLHRVRDRLPPGDRRAVDRRIGEIVREINGITGPDFGYVAARQPRFATWPKAFDRMLRDVLADGEDAGVSLGVPYPEILALCRHRAPALAEVREARLVHWDVWAGNVFVDPDRLEVTGLIDCERSLWGDPLLEFNFREYDPDGGFAEGYGRAMLTTEAEQARRALYDVYLYAILIVECAYRGYPTDNQERWARPRLDETIGRLQDGSFG